MENDGQKVQQLINEVEKVILGKTEVIQLTVAALLAGGHVLFEDIPGVGKTVLVKALAKAIQGTFSRVQFTPDLLPGDILGVSVFNSGSNQFEFRPGPIFTTVLLADEINRSTPRTQAALLEAMSEGQVTIDNRTYPLDENFFVLATQNPIEYEGTYPLPEAQLDRFLFRLSIGYPSFDDELQLITGQQEDLLATVETVLTQGDLQGMKKAADAVYVDPLVVRYALELVQASRQHPAVALGVSPRGGIAFIKGAKAFALTQGRNFVTPEDLQRVLPFVFGHRLLYREFQTTIGSEQILTEIRQQVAVPVRKGE